jgi:hypothetical protein
MTTYADLTNQGRQYYRTLRQLSWFSVDPTIQYYAANVATFTDQFSVVVDDDGVYNGSFANGWTADTIKAELQTFLTNAPVTTSVNVASATTDLSTLTTLLQDYINTIESAITATPT